MWRVDRLVSQGNDNYPEVWVTLLEHDPTTILELFNNQQFVINKYGQLIDLKKRQYRVLDSQSNQEPIVPILTNHDDEMVVVISLRLTECLRHIGLIWSQEALPSRPTYN